MKIDIAIRENSTILNRNIEMQIDSISGWKAHYFKTRYIVLCLSSRLGFGWSQKILRLGKQEYSSRVGRT
jgi:hypothetical protein